LLALTDGYRESEQSWREVLWDLKARGLTVNPHLALGEGALGFWEALPQVYGTTRGQRCWVHKTANVLNKLPKSQQPKAKAALHEIWMAATQQEAEKAFDHFLTVYRPQYDKAINCLEKDREFLLAFYNFPEEHWIHLRTTNPIESTFATVRRRTDKTWGCVSRESILAMVFKLMKSGERHWRKLNGIPRLAQVIEGVVFKDGVREDAEKIAASARPRTQHLRFLPGAVRLITYPEDSVNRLGTDAALLASHQSARRQRHRPCLSVMLPTTSQLFLQGNSAYALDKTVRIFWEANSGIDTIIIRVSRLR
jgi:hypothetical protein